MGGGERGELQEAKGKGLSLTTYALKLYKSNVTTQYYYALVLICD